jgi:hypothetical protein
MRSSTYGKIMILFDLSCGTGHRFEGWFRSNETFEEQQAGGAIFCPLCGNTNISKAPMAPHVRRATARQEDSAPSASASQQQIREDLQALRRQVESTCDYVGLDFPQEARRIHYGETDARNIYGEATEREAKELASEGVAFRRIPWFPRRND